MTNEQIILAKIEGCRKWHFAWDRYEDKEKVLPKFELFNKYCKTNSHNKIVYTLVNYDTTLEQDLERIYTLRNIGYAPYVMVYDKEHLPKGHELRRLQRYVNNRFIFWKCDSFEDYLKGVKK